MTGTLFATVKNNRYRLSRGAKRLADEFDPFSATRGDTADDSDAAAYRSALDAIVTDPSNEILVVVNETNEPLAKELPRAAVGWHRPS
jgi:hypothetical protein